MRHPTDEPSQDRDWFHYPRLPSASNEIRHNDQAHGSENSAEDCPCGPVNESDRQAAGSYHGDCVRYSLFHMSSWQEIADASATVAYERLSRRRASTPAINTHVLTMAIQTRVSPDQGRSAAMAAPTTLHARTVAPSRNARLAAAFQPVTRNNIG